MQLQVSNAAAALIAGAGFAALATPRVDLVTAISGLLTADTVWADLTIAAYTGYPGPVTVTVSADYVSQPSGLYAVDVSDAVFNGPSAGAGVDVIGLVFHDTTATPIVYAIALFDGPITLASPTDRVTVDETILIALGLQASVAN